MSAKLLVITGPSEGQVCHLPENGHVTIGRTDKVDFRINDPTVSRSHCTVQCAGGKIVVTDNGSTSGTWVHGKAITTHALRPGEIIHLGATQLRFQTDVAESKNEVKLIDAAVPDDLRQLKGSRLKHYQIGEVVAVGSSGVVFRANDEKENREVALKVYLPTFSQSEEDLQRFIRAVKTMLPKRHPNLVTLFGGGKSGPYCWMAMEYVEGESLTETIARIGKGGKLDWRPALNVAIALCNGLYYLHSEQIIHRSLSPSNILFSRLGVAKLGSLILAKALSGALATDVTMGGEILGDVRYLAPEQVGGGSPVDVRADIYSLGALIYALLTGKPPFEAKNPVDTAAMILRDKPAPPRKTNPYIPEPMEKIVLTMLAKKPADRFQSAGDLLADLEQLPQF
jgi:serine/threonine protein kinase